MTEYAQIAPDLAGYAYVDTDTGELVTLETDAPGTAQPNLRPASKEEIEGARRGLAARDQAWRGLGETALSNATFGLVSDRSPEAQARQQVLSAERPVAKGLAAVGGSLLPALAGGGLASAGARALGAGRLATGVASFAGEELAQGGALAMAQAAETDGEVDVGAVFQGMAEGAAFLGAGKLLAKGVRAVRGLRQADEAAEAAVGAGPEAALARGQARAKAEQAAAPARPTKKQIQRYAEDREQVHTDLNDLAYDAGNRVWGRDGSFDAAHSIGFKKQDIAGRMADADLLEIEDATEQFAEQLEELAAGLTDSTRTSAVSPGAARTLQAQAQALRAARAKHQLAGAGLGAGGPEDAAIALDQAKRHLDNLRSKFADPRTKATDPASTNVRMIDEVLEPMRESLENEKIWGKTWAGKQRDENRLWSGRDGIIESRAQWQAELTERLPGAAGTARTAGRDLPVSVMKDGFIDTILGLPKNKQARILTALENDVDKSYRMAEVKLAVAGDETRAAVGKVMADLSDMRQALAEARRVLSINQSGAPLIKKILSRKPIEDVALGALEKLPAGGALKRVVGEAIERPRGPALSDNAQAVLDRIRTRRNQRGMIDLGVNDTKPRSVQTAAESMGLSEFELKSFMMDNRIAAGPRGTVRMAELHQHPRFSAFLDRKAVERYTENSAFMVNKNLRTKGWNKPWAYQGASAPEKRYYEGMKGIAKRAAEVMRRTSDNPAPIYRGSAVDSATLKQWIAAGEVRDPAFMSFSTDESIARNFIRTENVAGQFAEDGTERIFIRAPRGGHSHGGPEREVMFAPDTPLQIKSVTKNGDITIIDVEAPKAPQPGAEERAAIDAFRQGNAEAGSVMTNHGGGMSLAGLAASPLGVGTAAAGLLGARAAIEGVNAETSAIRDLDEHSKATTEQAMLDLGANIPQPERMSAAQQFQGDHDSLQDAFVANLGAVNRLLDTPDELIARATEAFEPLASNGHPELASKLITRMVVGLQYLRENAPPTLGQSMFNPEGDTPDEIAVLQFAPVWQAVWRPLDTVRAFSAREATPSAVRAIREIHPDIYARMQAEVFQSLAPGGPGVDFDTKAYLDSTMQMGAALGRSFSPNTGSLLANQRQNNKPTNQSLSGENNVAPRSANEQFSKGPTSLR